MLVAEGEVSCNVGKDDAPVSVAEGEVSCNPSGLVEEEVGLVEEM